MAQYGDSNRSGTSGYGSTGQYGSSAYQSGYRGNDRSQDNRYGKSAQYGTGMQGYEASTGRDYSSSNYGAGSGSEIEIGETHRLIGSDKVEGTAVYDRDGTRIGTIHNFMVDKRSGKAEYAVMSFGGFLGMGQTYYPLPWQMLDYDTDLGGFRVEMDEEDLDHAPSFRAGGEPEFDDQYGRQVHSYYGLGI